MTRGGKIEWRVPPDRAGRFSTEVFARDQRREKARVRSWAELYGQGVSTRKVKAITEERCGHALSASPSSELNQPRDEQRAAFNRRRREPDYPYRIVDARDERVREASHGPPRAVLVARGISGAGRRDGWGIELANRQPQTSWKGFLQGRKARGLRGVEFVVSADHKGRCQASREVLTQAAWPRCSVPFLRNAWADLPRKGDDACRTERRWRYDRRDLEEARRDLAAGRKKGAGQDPKLCHGVQENLEDPFTFYRLPRQQRQRLKSTNLLERLNPQSPRRARVVRLFPNAQSALRLIRARAVELHEDWIEPHRSLNRELLREPRTLKLREEAA
jgi:transposase-like protein